jgi:hypothetical protein
MMMFNSLYRLGTEVKTECDQEQLFVGSAVKGRRAALVMANTLGETLRVRLELGGFSTEDVEILRIDEEHRYTLTGEDLSDGFVDMSPYSCVEIRLVDLR